MNDEKFDSIVTPVLRKIFGDETVTEIERYRDYPRRSYIADIRNIDEDQVLFRITITHSFMRYRLLDPANQDVAIQEMRCKINNHRRDGIPDNFGIVNISI